MKAILLGEMNFGFEELTETGSSEEIGFGAVGDDAAVFHHEDAVDLGWNVGDVMCDENPAGRDGGGGCEGQLERLGRGRLRARRGGAFARRQRGRGRS